METYPEKAKYYGMLGGDSDKEGVGESGVR